MAHERHLASLDAVRGIAALSVAIPHFFLFRGYQSQVLEFSSVIAVEVFFVLSGVVLAPQLLRCVETGSPREIRTFYFRRWMRTLPPYIIVLLGMAIAAGTLLSRDFLAYLFFLRNFVVIPEGHDFFMVAWSLAIEEWFYFVFPVFLVLVTRRFSAVVAGIAFIVILFAAKVIYMLLDPQAFALGRRIVILRVDSIAWGFLLSFVLISMRDRSRTLAAVALAGLAGLVLSYWALTTANVMLFVYAAPLFACSLILMFVGIDRLFAGRIASSVAAFFAHTSYMLYLVHTLIILALSGRMSSAPEWAQFLIYMAVLLGVCWLFFLFVEKPILQARPKYRAGSDRSLATVKVS